MEDRKSSGAPADRRLVRSGRVAASILMVPAVRSWATKYRGQSNAMHSVDGALQPGLLSLADGPVLDIEVYTIVNHYNVTWSAMFISAAMPVRSVKSALR